MKTISFIVMIFLSISLVQSAGIDKLAEFLEHDGTMQNYTAPKIIKDQAGGFATGGSLIIRGPSPKELTPLSVQMPKFRFDPCTGSADFRFGAFSYISADEFINFLKSTATSAGAYGAKMAIKTLCPQCEDIMTYLESVSRDINSFSLNQCAMGQVIANGVFSKINQGNQQKCLIAGAESRSASDLTEAQKECKKNKDKYGETEEVKKLLPDEMNLVWYSLVKDKQNFDKEFFELIMSVTGTLITTKQDGALAFEHLPPLFEKKEDIEKLIGTNEDINIELYTCPDQHKCLKADKIKRKLTSKQTIISRISKIIEDGLIKRVKNDDPNLTAEEESLVAYVSMPLLRLIEQEIAMKGTQTEHFITANSEFIEVIAYDLVVSFMHNLVTIAMNNINALQASATDITEIQSFVDKIRDIRSTLNAHKSSSYRRALIMIQLKERITQQEHVVRNQVMKMF